MKNTQATKFYGHYAIAASLSLLAASIGYFSHQLSSLEKVADTLAVYRDVLPELILEIAAIKDQVPLILDEVSAVREQLPAVLQEIAAVRKQVPPILEQIPPILKELSALRKDTIPSILAETQILQATTIPAVLLESQALREDALPALLIEVKATRQELPLLLSQANDVAKEAGKSASEGAVSGFFSGIIKAPLDLVAGVGGAFSVGGKLTARDKQLLAEASEAVIKKNYLAATQAWDNPKSGRRGDVTLTAMVVGDDERCRGLTYAGFKKRKVLGKTSIVVCHDEKGQWSINE